MENRISTPERIYSKWTIVSALLGAAAVALGAFGAHGLKPHLTPESLGNYQTAVLYHFIHTLALLVVSYHKSHTDKLQNMICLFFALGILLFSGSLYLIATNSLTGIPTGILGPITPLGGLAFIFGWGLLVFKAWKTNVK